MGHAAIHARAYKIQKWVDWANISLLLVIREMLLPLSRISITLACLDLIPCHSDTPVENPYPNKLKRFAYTYLIGNEELSDMFDISLEYSEDSYGLMRE